MASDEDKPFRDLRTGQPMTIEELKVRSAEYERHSDVMASFWAVVAGILLIGLGAYLQQSDNYAVQILPALTPSFGFLQWVLGFFGIATGIVSREVSSPRLSDPRGGAV